MRNFIIRPGAALLTFAVGVAANSLRLPLNQVLEKEPSSVVLSSAQHGTPTKANPAQAPCVNPSNMEEEFPGLIEDEFVTKFNGKRLDLDYDQLNSPDDIPFLVDAAKVTPFKTGGLLVDVGNTLYRLNEQQQVVWAFHTAQWIIDYTLVESTNLLYGTAGDNVMFILDAGTGKLLDSDSRNGSAAYGATEAYGKDMCLVMDNFSIYREKFRAAGIEPMKDGITCWRGTKILWHRDFPPDAELVVNGTKILAVTKTKSGIHVTEIDMPIKSQNASK